MQEYYKEEIDSKIEKDREQKAKYERRGGLKGKRKGIMTTVA